jgi:UDP-2-acetamido-2,6-beta-L-arabino-hexul-4-ose reductase
VIAVTGAAGFVGWHVCCAARAASRPVLGLGRADDWVASVQAAAPGTGWSLVHAAGVNRGEAAAVHEGNVTAARRCAALLVDGGVPRPSAVVYVDSIQAGEESPYGRGKAEARDLLASACASAGVVFVDLVVPNVFGEHGRPDYNSFVATFCDRLVRGQPVELVDRDVELVHVSDVADAVLAATTGGVARSDRRVVRVAGRGVRVSWVWDLLRGQHEQYLGGVIPDLSDGFERALFNTLRAALYPAVYPLPLEPRSDQRGTLVETVKAGSGGQSFVSWTNPGSTRGNHFHRRKFERFLVLGGEAEIRLRRLFSAEVVTFRVSGDRPEPVDMPCLHTHSITNVGEGPLLTLFWTDEIFDPDRPDTWVEPVEPVGRAGVRA